MAFVYLATWSNGAVYVGQTFNSMALLETRYGGYSHSKRKTKRPSEMACRLYGIPTLQVLETCKRAELSIREAYWIGVYSDEPSCLNQVTPRSGQIPWPERIAAWNRKREERLAARISELLGKTK
jgi:hypothetical protein